MGRRILGTAIICFAALAGACDEASAPPPAGPTGLAASSRVPRLSHAQWENTVQDLLRLDQPVGLSASFAPDPLGGKVFDHDEDALSVASLLWANYQAAAETVAGMVTTDAALLAAILPPDLPAEPAAKARAFLADFGRRAYRRPLSAAELDAYAALFDQGAAHFPELGDPFVAGVRLSLEGFLQSPHFLYRAELTPAPATGDRYPLGGFEVASRLSYALWDTMPDDELLRAAEAGELAGDAGLGAQVERLLADPRAEGALLRMHDQLYDADQYLAIDKSTALYPSFDATLGAELREELRRFVRHVLLTEGGGVAELLTSRTTFVTQRLADLYGVAPGAPDADGFSQVELDPALRSGLLTRAGFLAWKGTQTQPDTILRGVFVNLRIVCRELGDPPDAAAGAELGGEPTNREKVDALTGPGTCGASCHGKFINPIGYAFEHYGALGEWRDEDNGFAIDASASYELDDEPRAYADAVELSDLLAGSAEVHACYAGFLAQFLLARDLHPEDTPLLDELATQSLAGASARELVVELVKSDAFRMRPTHEEVSP